MAWTQGVTPRRREALILVAAGVAAASAGFLVGPAFLRGRDSADAGELWSTRLPDLAGKSRQVSEWRGRVVVCNFWATWCAPCREEIPVLMAARQKSGPDTLEVVGIAVDNAAKVGEFARSFRISYPVLISDGEGLELMRKLGNTAGGLPYTVFLDRQGRVAHRKLGALTSTELDGILESLTK